MHGLVNRSIQHFVCDTQGWSQWERICEVAGTGFTEFEAMMRYDRSYTPDLVQAMIEVLGRPRAEILEDLGTYLVTNPDFPAIRRLLRFSGVTFTDFLHALDDLPDRVRLAIPDLSLPDLTLTPSGRDHYLLTCQSDLEGFGFVLLGLLRAMADDYGTLAVLDHVGRARGVETLDVQLIEADYAEARHFELGAGLG